MSDEFDFSGIKPIEIPVKGPDGNDYVLKEANGTAAKLFNDARIGGVLLGEEGNAQRVSDIGKLEPYLVSLCLFGQPGDRPIKQQVIEQWPYQVIKKLYNKAIEISHLSEKEDPILNGLNKVLSHGRAPTTMEELRTFVSQFKEDKEIKPLYKWLKEDPSKNSQRSMTDGSELQTKSEDAPSPS